MSTVGERVRAALGVIPALPDPGEGRDCRTCGWWKPSQEFVKKAGAYRGLREECNECRRPKMRGYMEERLADRDYRFDVRIRAKYGLSREAYDALLAAQGGACGICGTTDPGARGWHVDHDHACCPGVGSCGKCVRGLLCGRCNSGLGFFRDNPEALRAAAAYIEERRR